jgi:alkanesulfonate monooxygenase SsuD/methylene tetrahydromethanopterin reductase-like flavin-dependent oxidoreductase (luciferase family)
MDFGVQFFPSVGPETTPAAQYFDECLNLCGLIDEYGYSHVRTVEHYFLPYGGYSPNPMVFLTAASQRTKKARVITGAVLPIFNNPLKIAGEAGMLDAISEGRLELGMARAFLPHEFEAFGVSVDESIARFDEGSEQIRRLLEEENVTSDGQFHSFQNVTSLPRPTQKPRPPIWTATTTTPASFEKAGRMGYGIMAIPLVRAKLTELITIYRDAWRKAGHPGNGRVMLAFHMFCHENEQEAESICRDPLNRYLGAIVDAASAWQDGMSTKDYPGYDKMVEQLAKETYDSQTESGAAWIGAPEKLIDQITEFHESIGGFEIASMQVNFGTVPADAAEASMRLFGEKVIPKLSDL